MAKILLAIPTAGSIEDKTSVAAALLSHRSDVTYVSARGKPTDYVRNSIVRAFLTEDFTHLLFLDSDIDPPLDCIDRLLRLDVPLAGGCYAIAMPSGLRWALANKDSDGRYRLLEWLPSREQPFEVDAGGAGCLLIKRQVFDNIQWPWFRWIEHEDGSQVSEDIYFFGKCNVAGLRLTADPAVLCHHEKKVDVTAILAARKES